MASKIDITKLDLYDILNVTEEATEKEVKVLNLGVYCLSARPPCDREFWHVQRSCI